MAIESPVFERMFFGGFRESKEFIIRLPDIDPKAFQMILEYVYIKEVEDKRFLLRKFPEILYATDKYMLGEFKDYSVNYLKSCAIWEPRYVLKIFYASEKMDQTDIKNVCIEVHISFENIRY